MDEQKKPFDTVSIVILILLSLANDGAEIFFDLLAATVVGLPGEAIMEPIDLAMDGIVTFWFFAKCGFGGPSIIQFVDDLLELIGVPGRTICVAAGILIANHPKLAAVAEVAAGAATGGAGIAATEAEGAAEAGAVAAKSAEALEGATVKTAEGEAYAGAELKAGQIGEEAGATRQAETTPGVATEQIEEIEGGGEAGEVGQEEEQKAREEELEKEMETEEEKPPEEVAQEKLFEQTPQTPEQKEEPEEGKEEPSSRPEQSNVISIEDVHKLQRAKETRENLEHPKVPREVTDQDEESEDEADENFRAAA